MAKEKTAKKAKAEDKESNGNGNGASEFKFGVQDIADELGIKPASVRVQLRNKGIEKAGKSYGWNSKSDLKEVIAQLKAADNDEDEKPAKKTKKEKPAKEEKKAKKASSKKAAKNEDDDDE